MRVAGTHRVGASREAVWKALRDPDVLARALLGCRSVEVVAPDTYAATVDAGVGGARGTYRGTARVVEQDAPSSCRLAVDAAGEPGTVRADVVVDLDEDGDATVVRYTADAVVGGTIAGIGQRMLTGMAQRTAGDLLEGLERELMASADRPAAALVAGADEPVVGTPEPAVAMSASDRPATAFAEPPMVSLGRSQRLQALVGGAVLAIVGVLVGRWTRRGR